MKKKVALTAAAVAMVGTLAVGGTLAWFTDTETATNVVTMGNVDVTLTEDGGEDGVTGDDGLTYQDVMPGDVFDKTVKVGNEGQDAYVRAIIQVSGNENITVDTMPDFIKDDTALDLIWSGPDETGVYTAIVTYEGIFAKDAEDWTVFDSVEIPSSWNNTFENANFNIKLTVEAIQAENNEGDPWATQIDYAAEDANKTVDLHKASEAAE